jgi:hypothetical protein
MCIEGDMSVCGSGSGWQLDWQWQGGKCGSVAVDGSGGVAGRKMEGIGCVLREL